MTDREVMQTALESIEWLRLHLERDHACLHMKPAVSGIPDWLNKTEAALRARLAQPELQREWVGLTDDEMMQIYVALKSVVGFYSVEKYARAIEAKLKEKNGY